MPMDLITMYPMFDASIFKHKYTYIDTEFARTIKEYG